MEDVLQSTQFTGDMACSVLCTYPKNKDRWSSIVDSAGFFSVQRMYLYGISISKILSSGLRSFTLLTSMQCQDAQILK